ncbi:MAG TPA: nucleotide exchange factor GrpE [Caldilineaceae bacterium]|nr:nucleotide exchange factor GrpE [Caldilineaceae bacterium]
MVQEKQAENLSEELANEPVNEAQEQAPQAAAAQPGETQEVSATEQAEVLGEAELIEQLRQELAEAQAKASDYLDKLQRTAADFQNSRRRLENQVAEEIERANAGLIMRLLPVIDDFDLAFQNAGVSLNGSDNAAQDAWLDGFRQIQKKLLDVLIDQGVTPIPTEGPFDPVRHEAISSEPSETVESGHIIAPVRAGYEYKGRVLRPALVRVAA